MATSSRTGEELAEREDAYGEWQGSERGNRSQASSACGGRVVGSNRGQCRRFLGAEKGRGLMFSKLLVFGAGSPRDEGRPRALQPDRRDRSGGVTSTRCGA